MYYENLKEIIKRYEENYDFVNNSENEEKFKWAAVRCFRDVWFSENPSKPFAQLFAEATKESTVLINNSIMAPTTGVVKMAEQRPAEVEALFRDVLFAPNSTIDELQDHMDSFIEGMEKIRLELFPRFYRYKQDRHAASCYLTFIEPEKHFIYRYTDAELFAKYIKFGKDLGAGSDFSLANYYEMAELVVKELAEHTSLLEKYKTVICDDPQCYRDESLHLMAFDLMYCARCYNFYKGLKRPSPPKPMPKPTPEPNPDRIEELRQQIHNLELALDSYEVISLLGVQVHQAQYGDGVIVQQDINQITVQFADVEKSFIIHKKHYNRPHFENDEETVEAFSRYADMVNQKYYLEKELASL